MKDKSKNICPLTRTSRDDCGACQFLRTSHYNNKKACSLTIFEYEKNNGNALGFHNYLNVILNTVPIEDSSCLVEVDPTEKLNQEEIREAINKALNTLKPREKQILELRFGLSDGNCRTLEEVGELFKLSRERIRQIEAKAIRKLRHPTRMRKLSGLL